MTFCVKKMLKWHFFKKIEGVLILRLFISFISVNIIFENLLLSHISLIFVDEFFRSSINVKF